jgi:hypothetical protein
MLHMRKPLLTALAFTWIGSADAQVATSSGTEFWLTYMENLDLGGNGPPYLYIMASSYTNAQVTLEVPATGDAFSYTVSAGNTTAIFVPSNFLYPIGAEAYYPNGLKIVADQPITVQAYHHRLYFSDATFVLPTSELGTEYMVVAQQDWGDVYPSQFTIEATQDATAIEIVPSVETISLRPAGQPFTISLDEGEVFQLQAFMDLSGTTVRSLDPTKPIAVFGGLKQGKVNCNITTDHVWTQMMPTSSWGEHFAVVPYLDRGGDIFKITALQNTTTITSTTGLSITLGPGDHVDQLITVPALIDATGPIAVVQFNEGEGCNGGAVGDPCMAFVPARDRRTQETLFRALGGPGGADMGWITEYTLNIVTEGSAGAGTVILDGENISSQFLPMNNAPGWYYAQLPITEGEHHLTSSQPFQAQTSGFGSFNSYTYYTGYNENEIGAGVTSFEQPAPINVNVITADQFALRAPKGAHMLHVYDAIGRCVLVKGLGGSMPSIDVNALSAGGYIYRCADARGEVLQQGRLTVAY